MCGTSGVSIITAFGMSEDIFSLLGEVEAETRVHEES